MARANSPNLFDISSDDMPRMIVAWSIGTVILLALIAIIVLSIILARHNKLERQAAQNQAPIAPPPADNFHPPVGF